MVGTRIREARTGRNLSLNAVAIRAHISVATLSRIERDKQGLDLGLFLILCRILKTLPHELLGGETDEKIDPLALQIARLSHNDRVQLWHDLASARRAGRRDTIKSGVRKVNDEVEELMAQLQYLQAEIENVHSQMRKR